MQALRNRRMQLAGLAGLSLTASALLVRDADPSLFGTRDGNVQQQLLDLRSQLPLAEPDGSVLESVDFDGRKVRLEFVADERVDLRLLRDGERDRRCATWRGALRSGEVDEVEYRYRQGGAASSTHLNSAICG